MAKVVDETNGGVFLQWIVDSLDIDIALVEEMMEDIDSVNGGLALLFVSKNQVNPLVEVSADVVTLQCLETQGDTTELGCV